MGINELQAVLSENESEAVSVVKQTIALWMLGFLIITGNLLFNPLWVGPIASKIWLPAVYLAALYLLLVTKYNRRTEAGKIIFEKEWIRVFPNGAETEVFRISELEHLSIHSGKAGFLRNPFQINSFGVVQFRKFDQDYEFHFRLLRTKDDDLLHNIRTYWNS